MTRIRRAQAGDMPAAAGIVNDWIDETPWMPRVHPPDDVIRFYRDVVFAKQQVWVAENDGLVAGLMALDGAMISALYLGQNVRRQGVGSQLIDIAKQASAFMVGFVCLIVVTHTICRRCVVKGGHTTASPQIHDNRQIPRILPTQCSFQ